jgi:hypothetical protein
MTAPTLPEDLSRWPDDPFELLGIERGVPPKDLKRVYIRLIKAWKPEHHPEHFRRIREAYEAVLRHVEFFSRFEIQIVPETPTAAVSETIDAPSDVQLPAPSPASDYHGERDVDSNDAEPAIDPPARVVDASEPQIDPPARTAEAPFSTRSRNETADLWDRAIQGDEAEAYRGLKRLYERRSEQTTIALRLYWLLSLDPSHDPEKQPYEWLIIGLRNGGLQGPCMELLRREIEAEPAIAFSDRFIELLQLEAPTGVLGELLSWRWVAFRRADCWELFDSDFALAREKIGRIDDANWLRLLLIACDGVAWIPEGYSCCELWDLLQNEIKHLQHLANQHGDWFDRLEFLTAVRRDWGLIKRSFFSAPAFLDLIANSWHAPYPTFRKQLLSLAGEMAENPENWLDRLDETARVAPQILHAFIDLLRQAEWRVESPLPKPELPVIQLLAKVFMHGLKRYGSDFRLRVVRFCFRDAIDPAWIIESLLNHDIGWYSRVEPNRFVQLIEDWPVRILCQAYRVFWMSA